MGSAPYQIETWIKPIIRDEKHECYAITEEHAGSDPRRVRMVEPRTEQPAP